MIEPVDEREWTIQVTDDIHDPPSLRDYYDIVVVPKSRAESAEQEVEQLQEALMGIAEHAERATVRESGAAKTQQGDDLFIVGRKARTALADNRTGGTHPVRT